MRLKKRNSRLGAHWPVRPRAVCRIRARARVGILANAQCDPTGLFPLPVKVTRDNAYDSEPTLAATAALELPHPKTIRNLNLSTSVGWHPRTADLRAKKSLENSFTKPEALMRDFSARYHATVSSANTAKVAQFLTAIDSINFRNAKNLRARCSIFPARCRHRV